MLPNNEISGPDEEGIMTEIKYNYNEFGQLFKTITRFRKLKRMVKIPKRVIERRKWKKFGEKDDENTRTTIADEVFIETNRDNDIKIILDLKLPNIKEEIPQSEFRVKHEYDIKLENCIWVENISDDITEINLIDLFTKFGKIKLLILGKNCSIIMFHNKASYLKSFDLNRKFIKNRLLIINEFKI